MKELQFVAARTEGWALWDRWLGLDAGAGAGAPPKSARRKRETGAIPAHELPRRYRALCRDLSLARDRNYSGGLIDRLQLRVFIAHQLLYGAKSGVGREVVDFLRFGFPAAVQREWRVTLVAACLFFLPMIAVYFAVHDGPERVYHFMTPTQVNQFTQMYGPGHAKLALSMTGDTNWARYTGYIAHNLTINFQCFASGLAFGLGTIFYVLFNATMFGAVAGYLTQAGHGVNFWGFVAGHSGLELTGIVLSGAAGLKLGMALVAPGRRSRATAVVENARAAAPLIFGAILCTFMAASIEAFWSPIESVPLWVKLTFGATLWVVLWTYLLAVRAPRPTIARVRS